MKRIKKYFSSAGRAMSKRKKLFFALFALCLAAFWFVPEIPAQDLSIRLTIPSNSTLVEVEASYLAKNRIRSPAIFAFDGSASTVDQNAEKVSGFHSFDENDLIIPTSKVKVREYLARTSPSKFKYTIDIKSNGNFADNAHFSWLEHGNGIIMLRDLLPVIESDDGTPVSATVRIQLSESSSLNSSITLKNSEEHAVSDLDEGVFVIGNRWRRHFFAVGEINVRLAITGEWKFTDEKAINLIGEILPVLRQTFGEYPGNLIQITLFPVQNNFGRWAAETRGNSVTIISGDMMFQKLSIQRLHEQLRHEFLHLWIPNRLALAGNYDWFYEGFSIYQSLKTGVAMNRLSFDNFLETIAEAHRIANSQEQQNSLIEASKVRVSGTNRQVYAKGMLVAFLCDIAILSKSRGNRSISDLVGKVYRTHRLPNVFQDGNIAILNILSEYPELASIVHNYIEGKKTIDLGEYLNLLGIEAISEPSFVQLNVRRKLNRRQKDLLDYLGYNNWRKIGNDAK